ncbi:MAG: C-type lectin domain-containing protein [Planctomycetota bacterium]
MAANLIKTSIALVLASASVAPAAAQVVNPANGHVYELISSTVDWSQARSFAESSTHQGVQGHLVTISDEAERIFVSSLTGATVWIGAHQDTTSSSYSEPNGGWTWITGEPFQYTFWASGEPNNSPAGENVAQAYGWGGWNDALDTPFAGSSGFIIEYDIDACEGDVFDGNHSCGTAVSNVTFMIERDLVVSDENPDYFELPYRVGYQVFVRADFNHAEGDINLELYYADACDVGTASSSMGTGNSEEIRRFSGSDYVLKVSRNGGVAPCSDYQLTVIYAFNSVNLGTSVCIAAPNSTGFDAYLNAVGSDLISDNDFRLSAGGMPANTFGFFLNSPGFGVTSAPGTQGFLCINSGGIGRFIRPGEIQVSDSSGVFGLDVDLTSLPRPTGIDQIQSGESWAFQAWFRDATSTGQPTSNFTDGVMVWFD